MCNRSHSALTSYRAEGSTFSARTKILGSECVSLLVLLLPLPGLVAPLELGFLLQEQVREDLASLGNGAELVEKAQLLLCLASEDVQVGRIILELHAGDHLLEGLLVNNDVWPVRLFASVLGPERRPLEYVLVLEDVVNHRVDLSFSLQFGRHEFDLLPSEVVGTRVAAGGALLDHEFVGQIRHHARLLLEEGEEVIVVCGSFLRGYQLLCGLLQQLLGSLFAHNESLLLRLLSLGQLLGPVRASFDTKDGSKGKPVHRKAFHLLLASVDESTR